MQRSPSKWQSEQRDQYRCFVDSNTACNMEKAKSPVKTQNAEKSAPPIKKSLANAMDDEKRMAGEAKSPNDILIGAGLINS